MIELPKRLLASLMLLLATNSGSAYSRILDSDLAVLVLGTDCKLIMSRDFRVREYEIEHSMFEKGDLYMYFAATPELTTDEFKLIIAYDLLSQVNEKCRKAKK